MPLDPLSQISTRITPQSEQADSRQVPNSAGGFTFTLDAEARVRRFLVLGTDGATYYTSAKDLTKDNAGVILQKARDDAKGLTDILLEISLAGRAPKQNPTLFALAAAASLGDDEGRKYALNNLPKIARTGTHLFIFARYVQQFRGWGRGLRKAVAAWYEQKDDPALAYQMVKYRQREGWSHRDLLRKAHPAVNLSPMQRALFDWACGRESDHDLPPLIQAFERAKSAEARAWRDGLMDQTIRQGLSWEMLPDIALRHPNTWGTLLDEGMPMTALIRQLPRLTQLEVTRTKREEIITQLTNGDRLKKARIHPVNVLVALRTYASGKSARGESTWVPDRHIIDALDEAYYKSFDFVEPTGKRILLALDVSGSMGSPISNMPLTCREAAAAIAMTLLRTERNADIVGFTSGSRGGMLNSLTWGYRNNINQAEAVTELTISARQRLDDIINYTAALDFGGTDCAAPMLWALKQKRDYDAFIVITDNETWAGNIHPHQALEQYRQRTGIQAKEIVVGMTATPFSIADPNDAGSLDVAGFDSAVPTLISDFIRGF